MCHIDARRMVSVRDAKVAWIPCFSQVEHVRWSSLSHHHFVLFARVAGAADGVSQLHGVDDDHQRRALRCPNLRPWIRKASVHRAREHEMWLRPDSHIACGAPSLGCEQASHHRRGQPVHGLASRGLRCSKLLHVPSHAGLTFLCGHSRSSMNRQRPGNGAACLKWTMRRKWAVPLPADWKRTS